MKLIGPLSIEWASKQPFIEILIAGGIGTREEIKRLTKKRAISLLFIPIDHETDLLSNENSPIKSILQKYKYGLNYYDNAEFIVWIPLHPLMLVTKHECKDGILSVKVGDKITNIGLADETEGVYV